MAYLLILLAYLLGSVSSAMVVARLYGLPDPRTSGSGNPGATNILRLGSKQAFVSHLYPVFFSFRGGKGVATALGVYIGLAPWIGVLLIGTWLAVALLFRYSSLAALAAAVLSPVYVWWLLPGMPYLVMSIVIAALLLWRHRSNIKRLLRGEEDRIKFGKG